MLGGRRAGGVGRPGAPVLGHPPFSAVAGHEAGVRAAAVLGVILQQSPRKFSCLQGERLCQKCQLRVVCDERHLVFECPALQRIRDKYPGLFHVDTMRLFMWQTDTIGVANFIRDCFAHMHAPVVDTASDNESI